jgi:hypothetical protein
MREIDHVVSVNIALNWESRDKRPDHTRVHQDLKIGYCYSVLVFISMVPCVLRDDVSGGLKAAAHSKSHYS